MLTEYTNLDIYLNPDEVVRSRQDLHHLDASKNSDKVYILLKVFNSHFNTFKAYALYGRRGNRLTRQKKMENQTETAVDAHLSNLAFDKRQKGCNDLGRNTGPTANTGSKNKAKFLSIPFPKRIVTPMDLHHPNVTFALQSENFILEEKPHPSATVVAAVLNYTDPANFSARGWIIYNDNGMEIGELRDPLLDPHEEAKLRHTIFLAYLNLDQSLDLFDLCFVETELDSTVLDRPWKVRRTMMTDIIHRIYPSRKDPFEISRKVRLFDYEYQNKEAAANNSLKPFYLRRINDPFGKGTTLVVNR